MELFPPLVPIRHASQAGWDVPEANVGVLRLRAIINTRVVVMAVELQEFHTELDQMRQTHHSIEHHLISLPVLDLVVEVLREVQALVNVLLKPNGALRGGFRQ